jgi:hypothetical protein
MQAPTRLAVGDRVRFGIAYVIDTEGTIRWMWIADDPLVPRMSKKC